MIARLLGPLPMKVAAGIIAVLLVVAGVQTLRLSWLQADMARAERDKALAITDAYKRGLEAADAATQAMDAAKGAIEAGNDRARDAARGSDDPLRDGLEALR